MRSSLIWVCTVCSDLPVPILRIFTDVMICIKAIAGVSLGGGGGGGGGGSGKYGFPKLTCCSLFLPYGEI